jgi:hypothetical protein
VVASIPIAANNAARDSSLVFRHSVPV